MRSVYRKRRVPIGSWCDTDPVFVDSWELGPACKSCASCLKHARRLGPEMEVYMAFVTPEDFASAPDRTSPEGLNALANEYFEVCPGYMHSLYGLVDSWLDDLSVDEAEKVDACA